MKPARTFHHSLHSGSHYLSWPSSPIRTWPAQPYYVGDANCREVSAELMFCNEVPFDDVVSPRSAFRNQYDHRARGWCSDRQSVVTARPRDWRPSNSHRGGQSDAARRSRETVGRCWGGGPSPVPVTPSRGCTIISWRP